MSYRRRVTAASLAGVVAAALWWRAHPSACPYGQRWLLEIPRPLITRTRLLEILRPEAGERVLEVGPGSGHYAVAVAQRVAPGGRLDVLDIQPKMLDHTMARAARLGLRTIHPQQGDARELPYPDASFDAAYLVTVLGEVPDQTVALRELARVVKPAGRIVDGELFGDPHWVSPRALERLAGAAGLRLECRVGSPLAYFAELRRSAA